MEEGVCYFVPVEEEGVEEGVCYFVPVGDVFLLHVSDHL